MTGRDYGIDMQVEVFEEGRATGDLLLLQIKGTTGEFSSEGDIPFDLDIRMLHYARMFVAPVILVLCPVKAQPPQFFYLWLQEYEEVVLRMTKPDWASNASTVRVRVPADNVMPNAERRLRFAARHPRRLADLRTMWRLRSRLHELTKDHLPFPSELEEQYRWEDVAANFRFVLARTDSFQSPDLEVGARLRHTARLGLLAAEQLAYGPRDYSALEKETISREHSTNIRFSLIEARDSKNSLAAIIRDCVNRLDLQLTDADSNALRHEYWTHRNEHLF